MYQATDKGSSYTGASGAKLSAGEHHLAILPGCQPGRRATAGGTTCRRWFGTDSIHRTTAFLRNKRECGASEIRATVLSNPVQIASCIENHPLGHISVRPVEAEEDTLSPSATRRGRYFEDD